MQELQKIMFLRMQKDQWDDVINVNLNSNFLLTKLVIKGMIKKRWGRIVNITSVVVRWVIPRPNKLCCFKIS